MSAKKYPDPYPISETGPLDRISALWHFRDRATLTVVGKNGKQDVVPIKEPGLVRQVKTAVDFIFYTPSQSQSSTPSNPGKKNKEGPTQNSTVPVDDDEYLPQDMDNKEGEKSDGFWQIEPPLSGYYYSGIKSYYNPARMIWSKRKSLSIYSTPSSLNTKKPSHFFTGNPGKGIFSLPLPRGSQIDMASVKPAGLNISIDQNGCFYVILPAQTDISFKFYIGQGHITQGALSEDLERIDHGGYTKMTIDKVNELKGLGKSGVSLALGICDYIKTSKKYHVGYQAHIHRTSTSSNYIYNLDESKVLECYSANTLFVALARALSIPARLCTGHRLDGASVKDKKSHITGGTGHAWSEIWDGTKWILTDATPTQQDQNTVDDAEKEEKKENEKMEEMGFDPNDEKDKKLYKDYKNIQKEVAPDIRRLIAKLEAILPKMEYIHTEGGFKSGELDSSQLVNWKVEGRQNIFQRNVIEQYRGVMNLFEAIVLDRSGSMMVAMPDGKTRMEHVTRTAVIRAEVLAHFGIPTLLIFFDDTPECAMEWVGSVNGKKTNGAPARIMKGSKPAGGNNFTKALNLAYEKLETFSHSPEGRGRKGNITFVSDGHTDEPGLDNLIQYISTKYPTTAYFLGEEKDAWSLQRYFGNKNTIAVDHPKDLAKKMADRFDKTLRKELQKLLPFTQ